MTKQQRKFAPWNHKPTIPREVVEAIRHVWMDEMKPAGLRFEDLHERFPEYSERTVRDIARGRAYSRYGGPIDTTAYCQPKRTERHWAGWRDPFVVAYIQTMVRDNELLDKPLSKAALTDEIMEAVERRFKRPVPRRTVRDIIENRYRPRKTTKDYSAQQLLDFLHEVKMGKHTATVPPQGLRCPYQCIVPEQPYVTGIR